MSKTTMGLDWKLLLRYMQANVRGQHNLKVSLFWPFMTSGVH